MECFSRWNITHAGLYTFAQSPKHLALYQKFGFSARFLTAILSKPVAPAPAATTEMRWSKYSDATDSECAAILSACREITGAAYAGLDLEREIRAVRTQELGDTVLVWDDSSLAGFAVCHCGPGTEAGNGKCYVKFGMVRPGVDGARVFGGLLARCEALAASRGLSRIDAGVNLNCHEAYRQMLDRGYRAELQGVAMHKPNEPGYHRPEIFVIDDWR
jgi:hypothetical protein